MSTFGNIAFVLFILLLLIRYVISLECYSCQDCGDPFNENLNETIIINGTGLSCTKVKGAYIVDRNITEGCSPFTAVGNGVWCCETDLCNDANQLYRNKVVLRQVYSLMPEWKRKVLVLRYIFNNKDFLMKRNEIRPVHLLYLRKHSNKKGGKIEFKVAESLTGKSFYWPLTTHQDEMIRFMEQDPYYIEGLVHDWIIYPFTVIEKN